jgi:hypothetical protein
MNRNTKRLVAIGAPLAVVAATGIAFAAWTTTGAGTGTAQSTTDAGTSTLAGQVHAADLYPGAASTVVVKVHNSESYPVVVTGIGAGYSREIQHLDSQSQTVVDCAATTVRTDAASNASGLGQVDSAGAALTTPTTVIASGGDGYYTLTSRMSNDPADGCKSKTFTLGGSSTDGNGNIMVNLKSAASAQGF